MYCKIGLYRKMINFILAIMLMRGMKQVNSLVVHNINTLNAIVDTKDDTTILDDKARLDDKAILDDKARLDDKATLDDLARLNDLALHDMHILDDMAMKDDSEAEVNVKMIDDEDYDMFDGSGDVSESDEDDNEEEYPDELIDEIAEDIIMAEEEEFVESIIEDFEDRDSKEYEDKETKEFVESLIEDYEDKEYEAYEDDQHDAVGREHLEQNGMVKGFLSSNLMAGILAAVASFLVTSVMAVFYVIFRLRKIKKDLCEEAELCGFLDDTTFSTKVIWKGDRKNNSYRLL